MFWPTSSNRKDRSMKPRILLPMIVLMSIASRSAWAVDHALFDTILRDNVRDAKVDYQNIRDHYLDQLTSYLNMIAQVDVNNLPRNEQLALYLNLYNAAMIQAIV